MTNRTKLTLLALIMFAATNIQSAEVSTEAQATQEEVTPTQQLYAAIDALDLEALQQILRAHPDEADKISENVYGHNQTPLRAIFYKYTKDVDQNIEILNAITTALLRAGANPSKIIEPSEKHRQLFQKNPYVHPLRSQSPLTLAIDLIKAQGGTKTQKHFLTTILAYEYPEDHPFDVNQVDGENNSALSLLKRSSINAHLYQHFKEKQIEIIKLLIMAGAKQPPINQEQLQKQQTWDQKWKRFSQYFSASYWWYRLNREQLKNDSLKDAIIQAMFEVDRANKTRDEFAQALDAASNAAIASAKNQDKMLTAQQAKHTNIVISCLMVPVLAFVCKKYALSAIKKSAKFVSNQLAPWMRTAITQAQ